MVGRRSNLERGGKGTWGRKGRLRLLVIYALEGDLVRLRPLYKRGGLCANMVKGAHSFVQVRSACTTSRPIKKKSGGGGAGVNPLADGEKEKPCEPRNVVH